MNPDAVRLMYVHESCLEIELGNAKVLFDLPKLSVHINDILVRHRPVEFEQHVAVPEPRGPSQGFSSAEVPMTFISIRIDSDLSIRVRIWYFLLQNTI